MTLLFIYNANSGKLNALFDAGHKLFSPKTYQCDLCALTFDTFSENKVWKAFREQSDLDMHFYHIDEFENEFPDQQFEYPVILKRNDKDLNVFLDTNDLNEIKDVESLIKTIQDALPRVSG